MNLRGLPAGSTLTISGSAILMAAAAWLYPSLLPLPIAALLALGLIAQASRHLTAVWVAWLFVAALSLEMALSDLIGPEAFQPTIAAVKGGGIGLAALAIVRFGFVPDRFNPVRAFVGIAAMGLAAGIHPDLATADMARSMIGSGATAIVPIMPAIPA